MKLLSGIIKLKDDSFVRLPYPMTMMELAHYRFAPIAVVAGSALAGGLATAPAGIGTLGLGTSGVLIGAGTGLAMAGQMEAAQAAEATAKYNQRLQEQQAREIERRTQFQQQRQAEAAQRVEGRMRAAMGKAGAVSTVGSPLLLQAKQASESELENLLIGREGYISAEQARATGRMDLYQSKVAKRAAYIGAGSTLLTGFSQLGMGTGASQKYPGYIKKRSELGNLYYKKK